MIHSDFDKDEYFENIEYEDWLDTKKGKKWRSLNRAIHTQ